MISVEECKKLAPRLRGATDDEIIALRHDLYAFAALALQDYMGDSVQAIPNVPLGSSVNSLKDYHEKHGK